MVDPNQYHIAAVSDLNGYIFSSQTADCHVSAAGQDRKYAIILLFHPHSSTHTRTWLPLKGALSFIPLWWGNFRFFLFFSSFSEMLDVFFAFLPETSAHSLWFYQFNWIFFFFETRVWVTHSHWIIDFLTRSQELIVITVFFGKENEMLVWQCCCSAGRQQSESWAMRNGEAALAVCKQTCVYAGYSGLKYAISLLKVQFVKKFNEACLPVCFIRRASLKNGGTTPLLLCIFLYIWEAF